MLIIRRGMAVISLLFLAVFAATASASNWNIDALSQQIISLLKEQDKTKSGGDITRKVSILTPPEKLPPQCEGGKLFPAGESALTGQQSVIFHCGSKRYFIRIRVEAEATYWIATRVIAPRQVIGINDIRPVKGPLTHLPRDFIFASEPVAGDVATRMIKFNQPLARSQLRKPWKVLNGNIVNVISTGRGFLVKAKGTALDNAAVGQPLRVRMKSGKILTGNVQPSGEVVINSAAEL